MHHRMGINGKKKPLSNERGFGNLENVTNKTILTPAVSRHQMRIH